MPAPWTDEIPVIAGIGAWAGRYDAAILDLWGVVHDGLTAYPAVPDCLARMRDAGMRILFLSNAPRRSREVVRRLAELGIARTSYDHIITSGDLVRRALSAREDPFYAGLGRDYYRLGPARDWGLMEDMAFRAVGFERATFILNTGLFDDDAETVADYEDFLAAALARRLPMVCANPDHSVMRGQRLLPCAGALAAAYEGRGGPTSYRGKPDPAAYEACLAAFGGIERSRILAVGDSLHTDIAGARGVGIDAVFVTSGVHAGAVNSTGPTPDMAAVVRACAEAGTTPTAAMTRLAW